MGVCNAVSQELDAQHRLYKPSSGPDAPPRFVPLQFGKGPEGKADSGLELKEGDVLKLMRGGAETKEAEKRTVNIEKAVIDVGQTTISSVLEMNSGKAFGKGGKESSEGSAAAPAAAPKDKPVAPEAQPPRPTPAQPARRQFRSFSAAGMFPSAEPEKLIMCKIMSLDVVTGLGGRTGPRMVRGADAALAATLVDETGDKINVSGTTCSCFFCSQLNFLVPPNSCTVLPHPCPLQFCTWR